jgi:hypothetical protein
MQPRSLLQDESEGYEPQRLSRWFASRLDAREVVRNNFRKELTNVRSKTQDEVVLPIRPWENEPDHAEWVQEVSGYKCRISRNKHRVRYVVTWVYPRNIGSGVQSTTHTMS